MISYTLILPGLHYLITFPFTCVQRRFSSEAFNGDEGSRNSALEGDILTLLSLLEGACQRNPEIFHVLREQHNFDSQGKLF